MMKRWSTLFVVLAACNSSFATPEAPQKAPPVQAAPPPPPPPKQPVTEAPTDKESQIITDELKKMNGDDFGKPSSQFNAGNVSARKAPAAHKTKTGYESKFGNGSA